MAGRYVGEATRTAYLYNESLKKDPETLTGFIRVPSANQVVAGNKKMLLGDFPTKYMFVSAETENLEAVMRFLNVLHDLDTQRMIYSGIEGEHWNYVDGVPTFTDEMQNMIATNDEKLAQIGVSVTNMTMLEMVQASFEHTDGYPVNLTDSDEARAAVQSSLSRDLAEHYGVEYATQASMKLVEEGKTIDMSNDSAQLIASAMNAMPTDISRIVEKCNDCLYRSVPELIMAKDEAEFKAIQERVLKELADVGEAEAWEWCLAEYETAKERILPIFEANAW